MNAPSDVEIGPIPFSQTSDAFRQTLIVLVKRYHVLKWFSFFDLPVRFPGWISGGFFGSSYPEACDVTVDWARKRTDNVRHWKA